MTQRLALMLCIAGLIACVLVTCARADVCFADADGVRRHSPGAWPSYTLRMPGHKGGKCWYPTTKERRHVRYQPKPQAESEVMRNDRQVRTRHDTRPRPARSLAGAVPLPPVDPMCSDLCLNVRETLRIKADWDVYFRDGSFWGATDKAQMFREFEAWRTERGR